MGPLVSRQLQPKPSWLWQPCLLRGLGLKDFHCLVMTESNVHTSTEYLLKYKKVYKKIARIPFPFKQHAFKCIAGIIVRNVWSQIISFVYLYYNCLGLSSSIYQVISIKSEKRKKERKKRKRLTNLFF